jgi:hypothetical protein
MKQNLIGTEYGKIKILSVIPFKRGKYTDYKAKVLCNWCSTEKEVYLKGILDGKTKSCGCQQYSKITRYKKGIKNALCEDLTGKIFDKLSVKEIDSTKTNRIYWICKCECGVIKSIMAKHLKSGLVKSCGCSKQLTGKKNNSWKGYEEISGKYWNSLIRGAKIRKLEFNINIEYAWELFLTQNKKCALTGIDLIFESNSKNSTQRNASLDRIDNTKGYIRGNVQWVDKRLNVMKMDLSLDFFLNACKMVTEYKRL